MVPMRSQCCRESREGGVGEASWRMSGLWKKSRWKELEDKAGNVTVLTVPGKLALTPHTE